MNPTRPNDRVSVSDYRRLMASGRPGSAWRGKVAKPTDALGIRFPSKIQARVYQILQGATSLLAFYVPGRTTLVVRDPILDLPSILGRGGRPARYRPDFMVVSTVNVGEVCGTTEVSIHEAKGSKGAESRDWRLRAGAALKAYPGIPMFVWRYKGKEIVQSTLQEVLG